MIRTIKRRWFDSYWTLTFDDEIWNLPKKERLKLFWQEYNNHKFRKWEYFDKYLDKMLYKYDLELEDYYNLKKEIKNGNN